MTRMVVDAWHGRKDREARAISERSTSEQVRFLPEPLASERLVPVVRGSCDDTINVLASCSRIEGRAGGR
jgi:hypothetical protein